MRIGLIGINKYPAHLNFACALHAYAFQQFLDAAGFDAVFLDYRPVDVGGLDIRHPAARAERVYREAVVRGDDETKLAKLAAYAVGYRSLVVERERRYDMFASFISTHLRFTSEVYDSDLLEVSDPGFDCYVCVTDVIWSLLPRFDFDRGFLLASKAFDGKRKIAYAASRGASQDYPPRQRDLFFGYLREIDAISVREGDFGSYISENSELTAQIVLDPVLLQDREFWDVVAVAPRVERYLLLYYVMEQAVDTIAAAVAFAKLHDLTIVELSDRPVKFGRVDDPDVRHIARYDVSMEEWLGFLANAECVFTNSFHACAFSLIFETPFFVGRRNGNKVTNFLDMFDLEDRRFTPETDASELSLVVDFDGAKRRLAGYQAASREFILDSLRVAAKQWATAEPPLMDAGDIRRRAMRYPVHFHSGNLSGEVSVDADGTLTKKPTRAGGIEYWERDVRYGNDGSARIAKSRFEADGYVLAGWHLRVRIDRRWFWVRDDGSFVEMQKFKAEGGPQLAVFEDESVIPHLALNHIGVAVFVAQWERVLGD